MKLRIYIYSLICLLFAPISTQAVPIYYFYNVTGNSVTDAAIGVDQLSVEVIGHGTNQVEFLFKNIGLELSSICDVYFEDGTLLGIASIINGTGVSFSQYAGPKNLPGGNTINPPFVTTQGFLADSDSPVQPNGVNPGEQLGIVFNLISGQTYADTVSALNTGELRIGIHVQGFSDGKSESFVNKVPEPITLLLLGAGLLGVGLVGRKLRKG